MYWLVSNNGLTISGIGVERRTIEIPCILFLGRGVDTCTYVHLPVSIVCGLVDLLSSTYCAHMLLFYALFD